MDSRNNEQPLAASAQEPSSTTDLAPPPVQEPAPSTMSLTPEYTTLLNKRLILIAQNLPQAWKETPADNIATRMLIACVLNVVLYQDVVFGTQHVVEGYSEQLPNDLLAHVTELDEKAERLAVKGNWGSLIDKVRVEEERGGETFSSWFRGVRKQVGIPDSTPKVTERLKAKVIRWVEERKKRGGR